MILKFGTHHDIEAAAFKGPGKARKHSAADSAGTKRAKGEETKSDVSDSVALTSGTAAAESGDKAALGKLRKAAASSAGTVSLSETNAPDEGASGFTTGNGVVIDPFEPNNNIRKTVYTPPPEAQGEKEWTVLVYMAGDNDLEPYLVNNLIALEKVGSNDGVNVVVELDRGEKPKSPVTKWKGSRRFLVQKSEDNARVASPVVQELGPVNMADPQHLSDFIQWGMKNYPAKHYMVIINDHGYGFMGAADDKGNKDTMDLKEMRQAFDTASMGMQKTVTEGVKDAAQTTGKKIDVIGFDACLMGMVEVGYELKDYADVMVASQEVIGSGGWPYGAFADDAKNVGKKSVSKGPGAPYSLPPRDIMAEVSKYAFPSNLAMSTFLDKAQRIIENKGELSPEVFAHGIITQCEKHIDTTPTMAAVRLGDYMTRLADSLKGLGAAMKDSEFKNELLETIMQTQHFNMNAPEQNPYGDFRDIQDFCQRIIDTSAITDEKLKTAAKATISALEDAIIDKTDAKFLPQKYKDSHGMSVYLPDTSGGTDFGYKQTSFDKDTGWLENVRQVAVNDPEEKWEPLYKPPKLAPTRKSDDDTA